MSEIQQAKRRALFVTLHYPPATGSGVQRMLAFSRDLAELGWTVDILTVSDCALPDISTARVDDIPQTTTVIKAFALDTVKFLSVRGRYPQFLGLPDRWTSWQLGGYVSGRRYIKEFAPDIIFSSFPVATAHKIALSLHRWSGIPWVADFRDPMAQDEYPKVPAIWRSFKRIEVDVVKHAAALVFTSESARTYYQNRYPELLSGSCHIVANGYDEEAFAKAEQKLKDGSSGAAPHEHKLKVLHSGLLYPWERDPMPFFRALSALRSEGFFDHHPCEFVFRGSGFAEHFEPLISELNLQDLVTFEPPLSYYEALGEMLAASALLLFQADNSDFQIPAKTYEYIRSGRPIIALLSPQGDTGKLLTTVAAAAIADIASTAGILPMLRQQLSQLKTGTAVSKRDNVEIYSRRARAAELSAIFDRTLATTQR